MFLSDRIVFMELHKTGCTHIRNLLMDVVGGQLVGKHNRASRDVFAYGPRHYFGSVRNPWEWYVSLWAFGCDGNGELYTCTTSHQFWGNPVSGASTARGIRGDPAAWKACYTNADDADAFRRWLPLVMEGPLPRPVVAYGAASMTRFAGLMTYRYVHLFCRYPSRGSELTEMADLDGLVRYEQRYGFITHFIRNEALEDGLIEGLRGAGIAFNVADVEWIRSRAKIKTYASSRRHDTSYFYTPETAALV